MFRREAGLNLLQDQSRGNICGVLVNAAVEGLAIARFYRVPGESTAHEKRHAVMHGVD